MPRRLRVSKSTADEKVADPTPQEYSLYLDERKMLIDAARESARTFDKAVLAFGSAVFGFSIAFVKDVAPNPVAETLVWLKVSWLLFSLGLLAILLSFLFSHQACMYEIKVGENALGKGTHGRERNPWSIATNCCNILCILFFFSGLLCWSSFASDNLRHGETPMNKVVTPTEKRGYVPPPPPAKAPSQQQAPSSSPTPPATRPTPKK
jgi:hypothetical protein